MIHSLRAAAFAAAILAAALPLAAHADTTIVDTGAFVDESVAGGAYFIDASRYLGVQFTLGSAVDLSSIGGNFTAYGDGGSIFGAIVPVVGGQAGDVATTALAEALFTPAGGEQSAALHVVLNPGTYAVVFGSGLFGATGASGLVGGQGTLGAPSFLQYADGGSGTLTASGFGDDTLRITVTASAVPEPASVAMMCAGLLAMGAAARRRDRRDR